jgi:ABC-type branched-subunit amino acid transport system substrate-binding protein
MGAVAWVALAVLTAGCQATTQPAAERDVAETSAPVYPATAGSPGLSANTIRLGIPGTSDEKSIWWAARGSVYRALDELIDAINADGGVLGYELEQVPMFDHVRGDETATDEVARSICGGLAKQSTFAMAGLMDSIPSLEGSGCVGPSRTVNVLRSSLVRAADLDGTSDVVAPYALDDVTAGRTLVRRLNAQGFFDGATKVAVLSPSTLYADTAEEVVVAELQALGIAKPLVITKVDTTDAIAGSVVLEMKTAEVDRIVYLNDTGSGFRIWTAMIDQQFTPRFGTLNSSSPGTMISLGYPSNRLSVVSTLGGFVTGQAGDAALTTLPDAPASKRCEGALRSTGMQLSQDAGWWLLTACDVVALSAAALEASGATEPSTEAFFEGLTRLTAFESAYGVDLDFSHGRAGAGNVWDLKGNEACECLKVTGGPHAVARS